MKALSAYTYTMARKKVNLSIYLSRLGSRQRLPVRADPLRTAAGLDSADRTREPADRGLFHNNLAVRWDAATDETFLVGYEIYLNGTLISKVGGTSGYVPYRSFGTYIVRVRAWDSSGNFGPYAQVGIAIDPPPFPWRSHCIWSRSGSCARL